MATVKVNVALDFSDMAGQFRAAAEALEALQASLTPASPVAPSATVEPDEIPAEDPQGP